MIIYSFWYKWWALVGPTLAAFFFLNMFREPFLPHQCWNCSYMFLWPVLWNMQVQDWLGNLTWHGTNHLLIYHGHCSHSHFTCIKQPLANNTSLLFRQVSPEGGRGGYSKWSTPAWSAWWMHSVSAQKRWLLWHCCWRLGVYHDRPPSVHACDVYIGQIKSEFKMSRTLQKLLTV